MSTHKKTQTQLSYPNFDLSKERKRNGLKGDDKDVIHGMTHDMIWSEMWERERERERGVLVRERGVTREREMWAEFERNFFKKKMRNRIKNIKTNSYLLQ